MALEQTFVAINLVLGVAGVGGITGIGVALWRAGARENDRNRDVAEIKKELTAIKETVQKDGIVKELKTLQINCAGQMAALTTALNDHLRKDGT